MCAEEEFVSNPVERPGEARGLHQPPLQERFYRRFLVFHGRIGRLQYLVAAVLLPIAALLAAWIIGLVLGLPLGWVAGGTIGTVVVWLALVAWLVVAIWIGLAAGVRRSHDLGFSGWLLLLSLVPLVGSLLAIVLLVWPGEKRENKYGSQP